METLLLNRLATYLPSIDKSVAFNSCKWTVFKTEHFLNFFTAIKCICWHIWAFVQTEIQISQPFQILQLEKALPFHIPKACG